MPRKLRTQTSPPPLILRVHRFGTGRNDCYSMVARRRIGHPLDALTPLNLYEGVRGSVLAGQLARSDLALLTDLEEVSAARDYHLAMVRIQLLAVELVRRAMPGANIEIRDLDAQDDQEKKSAR